MGTGPFNEEWIMTSELETSWLVQLEGKSLLGVRPEYNEHDRVPAVVVSFTDNTKFKVSVKDGVFFEGCLINILRKAQPVYDVVLLVDKEDTYLEVRAETFPMFTLMAQNKRLPEGEFPFHLEKLEGEWKPAAKLKQYDRINFQGQVLEVKQVLHTNQGIELVAYNGAKRMVVPTFAPTTLVEVVHHAGTV